MDSFIQFLSEYKSVLVGGFTLVLTIVLLFIKKRPKTIDDFLLIIDEVCAFSLPSFISKVEVPGNGLSKKKEVRDLALSKVSRLLGRSLSDSEKTLALKTIDESIEAILSTPQKKL